MEAHVHVVFPQDPIADAGRHGRGAFLLKAAAAGTSPPLARAVVWERAFRPAGRVSPPIVSQARRLSGLSLRMSFSARAADSRGRCRSLY